MIRLGLIGYPVSHSLSPVIQAAALRSCGLEGDYSLFPIHPEDKPGLKDLLDRVRTGEIQGLNVTIPHKQNVIEFLDELTPTAVAIGAVNTIYKQGQILIGDNTDAPGFLSDLKKSLTTVPYGHDKTLRNGELKALVLGAGGSARAVIYSLLQDGWEVTIAARRMEQVERIGNLFPHHKLHMTDFAFSNIDLSDISLIINTTPVGMTPNVDQSPWLDNLCFPPHAGIYDLVYNPRQTRLVRDALAQERPAITGLGMLIEQAALAFELWTGHRPSREPMLTSATQSLLSTP
jgi:shikimate dehydrogenase